MLKTKKLIYAVSLAVLAVSTLPGAAFAGWKVKFSAPSSPSSSMRIDLPDDLDIATLTTLGVELDGMDITALLSLDGVDFVYMPPAPLAAGVHHVRLVSLDDAGERGNWNFTIAGGDTTGAQGGDRIAADEAWLRSASVNVNTDTEFSARIADANLGNAPDRGIVSGGGDVTANFESGNWSGSTTANYMAMSDKTLSETGNVLDIGEYNVKLGFTGDTLKSGVELGHQDVGLDNFLFSGFNRRGASLSAGTNNSRIEAKTFTLRTETLVGGRAFTGVDDANHRVDGGMFAFKPFSLDEDALKMTGVYYTGEGAPNGTSISDANAAAEGKGWAGILEKGFGNGRGTLRGEYARSDYDADGSGLLVGENKSDAFSVSGDIRPFEKLILWDRDANLTVGARYERIDTFFQSLGNSGLPADRDAVSVFANLSLGAFSGNLQLIHETNNVDDLTSAPTDRTRSVELRTNYSFDQQTGERAWMGTPHLSFDLTVADTDRDKTPVGYVGPGTDNQSHSATLGFGSSFDKWNWSASHMITLFEDDANVASDTVDNLTSLSASWTPSDRMSINSGLQFGSVHDDTDNTSNYNNNFTLGGTFALIPEKFDFNFDYNLNLATGSNDTPDKNVLNSEVEWTFLPSGSNHPGLALALRGSMEDNHEDTTDISNDTNYQLFSVLRIKAPYAYNR